MNQSQILLLFDYNYWANRRLLQAADMLPPDQLSQSLPMSWDSVLGTFVHIMGGEWIWRMRCQAVMPDKRSICPLNLRVDANHKSVYDEGRRASCAQLAFCLLQRRRKTHKGRPVRSWLAVGSGER